MTREEAVTKIEKLLLEIADVCKEYCPDSDLLNMAITSDTCWAFNAYWDRDSEHPIDITIRREAK